MSQGDEVKTAVVSAPGLGTRRSNDGDRIPTLPDLRLDYCAVILEKCVPGRVIEACKISSAKL